MDAADLEPLRAAGLDDRAIHDAVQAVSYFNYINRVADALGVDLEPEMPGDPRSRAGSAEEVIRAAGEALAVDPSESGTMTIVWRCMRCNHHFPAGRALPDACDECGAPKTEFALVEED